MPSLVDAESILVVDVGTIYTRAFLFDFVEGRYRFISKGTANTTSSAPFRNIGEGVRLALEKLQSITGHQLLDESQQLIIPSPGDGTGIDRFAATISAGNPLNLVVVGLLEDVSVESAQRLAQSTYSKIQHVFSLNDRATPDRMLNLIVRTRPDLVVAAGGMDGGAAQSVLAILESIGLACYMLPETERPELLFAGNQSLHEEIRSGLQSITHLHFAPNIRPGVDAERLDAAQSLIARQYIERRLKTMPGAKDLKAWAGENLSPTASAFGRVVRFLSAFLKEKKGVLGVDLGASAAVVAAAFDGELSLAVMPEFGLKAAGASSQALADVEDVMRWLTIELPPGYIQEYLLNKFNYPFSLPASIEAVQIEQAVARLALQKAVQLARPGFPKRLSGSGNFLPYFEPIIYSGSVFSKTAGVAESAQILLDGLQPTGITTLVLDQNQIAPAIGAAAVFSPLLAVQVMDSNSFVNVGTVIAPIADVKNGQPVLRVKMSFQDGHEATHEITHGSLKVLPVPYGQMARLVLHPLHRADIGMGAPGRGGSLTVKGGALGVIIDARGRPIGLPKDSQKRQELIRKWAWSLGSQ